MDGTTKCIECGAEFTCGMRAGHERCWCADLPAVMPMEGAEGCLCRECLLKAIEEREKSAPLVQIMLGRSGEEANGGNSIL